MPEKKGLKSWVKAYNGPEINRSLTTTEGDKCEALLRDEEGLFVYSVSLEFRTAHLERPLHIK